jgi:hypothetical protein
MFRLDPDQSSRSRSAFRALQVLSTVLLLSAATACGKDEPEETPAPSGGSGGAAASSGSGGASGSTTPPPPMPVPCGETMCTLPSNPLSGLISMAAPFLGGALPTPAACCVDEATAACGVSMSAGGTCEPLAIPDTRCPKADLGAIGQFIGGAVRPCCLDNKCGQDGALFGRGCVDNSQVASMLGPLAQGGMVMFPAPQACDAPPPDPTTPDDDAGVPPANDTDAGT